MSQIKLIFNASCHLLVDQNNEGIYDLAEMPANNFKWYQLTNSIICSIVCESEISSGNWQTIHNLCGYLKTVKLARVLAEIDDHLYRIPYLNMRNNDYIYRFRTTKERNQTVYIDSQSESLYRSDLCFVIKEARRLKERSSEEPVIIDYGAIDYVIPSHFGFCLGVQNAIERAYETVTLNPDSRVFMLSELIHNPFVNEDLLTRGLRYLQTDKGLFYKTDGSLTKDKDDPKVLWNQLNKDDIVIIPAFGATNNDKAQLIRYGISIRKYDSTCMLVEKVWKAARNYASEGYTVIIHGKFEHEETKATFSNASSFGPALVIRNMEDAERLAKIIQINIGGKKKLFNTYFSSNCSEGFNPVRDLEKIAVVNQTTLLRNDTLKIINYLREVITEKFGEDEASERLRLKAEGDTLCYATQVNQDALLKALNCKIDAALVVGGKNSSNTHQLYRICADFLGSSAHYIQSEKDIYSLDSIGHYTPQNDSKLDFSSNEKRRPLFNMSLDKPRILLTGGASCPDGIIEQVIKRINKFFPSKKLRPISSIIQEFEKLSKA